MSKWPSVPKWHTVPRWRTVSFCRCAKLKHRFILLLCQSDPPCQSDAPCRFDDRVILSLCHSDPLPQYITQFLVLLWCLSFLIFFLKKAALQFLYQDLLKSSNPTPKVDTKKLPFSLSIRISHYIQHFNSCHSRKVQRCLLY